MGTGASVGGDNAPLPPTNFTFTFTLDGATHTVVVWVTKTNATPWRVLFNGTELTPCATSNPKGQENNGIAVGNREVSSKDLQFTLPNSKHILYVYEEVRGPRRGQPCLRIDNKPLSEFGQAGKSIKQWQVKTDPVSIVSFDTQTYEVSLDHTRMETVSDFVEDGSTIIRFWGAPMNPEWQHGLQFEIQPGMGSLATPTLTVTKDMNGDREFVLVFDKPS